MKNMALLGILALAALVGSAGAVKVAVQPRNGSWSARISLAALPPAINEFRQRFEAMPSDPGLNFSKTSRFGELKVLIGMLSAGRERDYRDVHRDTWMSSPHPKVCKIGTATKSLPGGCSVFATFVLGSDGNTDSEVEVESRKFGDVTLVTRDDGVPVKDDGRSDSVCIKVKVFNYFRYAVERFPQLTHVMKTDMDTYPYPGIVAHVLVSAYGRNNDPELSQLVFKAAPPKSWREGSDGVRLGKQGQFYGYSASALSCVYKQLRAKLSVNGLLPSPGDQPGVPGEGVPGEDGFFTSMMEKLTGHGGPCRPTWNLDTWQGHLKQPDLPLWVDVKQKRR